MRLCKASYALLKFRTREDVVMAYEDRAVTQSLSGASWCAFPLHISILKYGY